MSRDTKKELMWYQPVGDAGAMAEHLEKMAAKGWLLERADNWWLRYRRGEPVRVRYALTCFPDTTIFDAKPVEGQETYYDYCRAAGWEYVCSYGALQYFRNSRPNPVPIETDEALRLKALSRVMLRTAVLVNAVWLLMACFWLSALKSSFRWSPLSMVSQYSSLGAVLSTAAFFISSLAGLFCVGGWYLCSWRSVRRGGACTRIRSSLQMAGDFMTIGVMLAGLVLTCAGQAGSVILSVAVRIAGYLLLAVAIRALLRLFKRRNLSNRSSLAGTIAASIVLGLVLTFGMNALDRRLDDALPSDWPREIARAEMPLTLEDLGYEATEADQCSCEHRRSGGTPWAVYDSYSQAAQSPDSELPYLNYQIADIPWDWLRELCWDAIIQGPKYRSRWLGGCTPIDPAPWGADAAARRNGTQALLYGDRIVLIYTSWTPDSRESAIIGEKLAGW